MFDFCFANTIYLIFAYPKSEKDDLSEAEKSSMKKLVERIKETL